MNNNNNNNRVTVTLSKEARENIVKIQKQKSIDLSSSEEGGVKVNKGYAIAIALDYYVKNHNL